MTLNILQKYANSWRIDHKDLKDVYETTYAKGVISDFQIDDPQDMVGTIHSQVKVTGEFGESDWIPLFYHPKAQYWDDEKAKATDFDQDEVNFERAWMSFRGVDEVAVMLNQGKPVAVIGFADGLPRIGENIIKVTGQSSGWFDVLNDQEYAEQDVGKDGLQLKLTRPGDQIVRDLSNENNGPYWYWTNEEVGGYYMEFPTPPEGWAYNMAFQKIDNIERLRLIDTAITVGPFIFIIQILARVTVIHNWAATFMFASANYEGNGSSPPYFASDFMVEPSSAQLKPGIDPTGWGGIMIDGPYTFTDEGTYPWELYINVQIALYNEQTKDPKITQGITPAAAIAAIGTGDIWYNQYDGFDHYPINTGFIYNASGIPDGFMGEPGLEFLVRPHTKEELQAAGMWPQG